ncbi:MAG: C39 family peptidase, partial [Candidatus Sericytochromatia bacterium]|nr:C39 family peptidase [Candidatus Sericytochromatia bacterium]
MIINKNKLLNIVLLLSSMLTFGCSTPIAPMQSNKGTVINYHTNYRISKLTKSQKKIGAVKATDGTVTINGIPFFVQGDDNTCGQASITSILNYWGVSIDYQTVINESNWSNGATDLEVLKAYLINKGLRVNLHQQSNLDTLKAIIRTGKPPIVLLDFGKLSIEHYVIVSGYNETKKTILINDPRNQANMSMNETDFNNKWQNKSLGNLFIFGNK